MKKIITLTAILALLIPAFLSAQDSSSDRVTITREKMFTPILQIMSLWER
jgi:hypothetical protein